MNNERQRLVLFLILAFALTLSTNALMSYLGFIPKPVRRQPQAPPPVAKAAPEKAAGPNEAGQAKAKQGEAPPLLEAAKEKPIKVYEPSAVRLGSTNPATGYQLAVQIEQKGGGVAWIASSRFKAESLEGKTENRPLMLIQPNALSGLEPPSFALTLAKPAPKAEAGPEQVPLGTLDAQVWEVVPDDGGHPVHSFTADNPVTKKRGEGEEIVLRSSSGNPPVVVTKRYRLWKGTEGFELRLEFSSPAADQSLVYQLMGPHGLPIEGEWYTSTFRDVFFGQKGVDIKGKSAAEVVKEGSGSNPLVASPLLYAGVENQYFAVLVEPHPAPTSNETSLIAQTAAVVVKDNTADHKKADVSVQLTSKPIEVGPNRTVAHDYLVFAGPKKAGGLVPYGAEDLASYRKSSLPLIGTMAMWASKNAISPLLDRIYGLTAQVAGFFGGRRGNYGIAIILLTITVRLIMFPLSRKQAISAKKMQDLQPLMAELKEKYKDDKEKMTRETFALYGKHGVSPFGGCLPALIQLPIFIGLWQTLNNSVDLRQATFLWIGNLAAPDMLFRFPFAVPFLGDYFNLLPFLVVGLMLVQTKLFSPPATTPEAEMQQKMMKVMMVVMGFIFYWVPSGLGIYFITSSLWAVGERLLLPKMAAAHVKSAPDRKGGDNSSGGGSGDGKGGPGRGGPGGNGKPGGWLSQQFEKLLDEAAKDRTHRNEQRAKDAPEKDKEKDRDKGRPRARPGKRR